MFHKAIKIEYGDGTELKLTFRDGNVKQFDMAAMFDVYPPLNALEDHSLFISGKLDPSGYGIIWNDDLDLEAETVYQEGIVVGQVPVPPHIDIADALAAARAAAGISQKELAARTGINQADISRIERGIANPSVTTLKRLASGMNSSLNISFQPHSA